VAKQKKAEPVVTTENEPQPEAAAPEPVAPFSPFGESGWVIANNGQKSFHVVVEGVRFEHVATADDGRWIYAKS
jgi:hypothetical protein